MSTRRIDRTFVVAIVLFTVAATSVDALGQEPMTRHREAVELLREYTNVVCAQVSTEGGQIDRTLDARASVGLTSVLKAVANLGVEGGVKYQDMRYQGVLQEHLVPALRDVNNCRLRVLETLVDHLFPTGPPDRENALPYVILDSNGKLKGYFGIFTTGEECLDRLATHRFSMREISPLERYIWSRQEKNVFSTLPPISPVKCQRLAQESVWCTSIRRFVTREDSLWDDSAKKVCHLSIRDCQAFTRNVEGQGYFTDCEPFSAYEVRDW